jgi:hypothetical protein
MPLCSCFVIKECVTTNLLEEMRKREMPGDPADSVFCRSNAAVVNRHRFQHQRLRWPANGRWKAQLLLIQISELRPGVLCEFALFAHRVRFPTNKSYRRTRILRG